MSTKHVMMNRVSDIAHPDSAALQIIGPRTFTAEELLLLTADVARIEGFLNVLAVGANSYRSQKKWPGGTSNDVVYYFATTDADGVVTFGDLTVSGLTFERAESSAVPSVTGSTAKGTFTVAYQGQELVTFEALPAEVHVMINNLGNQIYHGMGSLLEEIAASYYKGSGDTALVTTYRQQALVRLQDKVTKQVVEKASQTTVVSTNGLINGETMVKGELRARDLSHTLLATIAPSLYDWLYNLAPLGTRAFNPAEEV